MNSQQHTQEQNKKCSYNNIITYTNQLIDFGIYNIYTGETNKEYIFGGWRLEKKHENWVFKNYYHVVFYNLPFVDSYIGSTYEPTVDQKQQNSITIPVFWSSMWFTYYLDLSNNGIDKIQYCRKYEDTKTVENIMRSYSYKYNPSQIEKNTISAGSKRRKSRKQRKSKKSRKSRKTRK